MTERGARPVAAVLLDLGGVLLRIHFERTLEHWARAAGLPAGALAHRFAADAAYARHERGELTFAGYAQHLRQRLRLALDDEVLLDGWNRLLGEPLPGAVELVAAIAARHPVFLFSNSNAAHHARWSRHRALLDGFREVFVSHAIGLRKPEPEAFAHVVSRMGVAPETVVFFDDLAENVDGARRAGLRAARVTGPADVAASLGIPPRA